MPTPTLSSHERSIAIIGAGLGGLTLAMALKRYGMQPKIYELRTPDYDFGGAIMLSPNALRVLDTIGAYERIRNQAFPFETMAFKTDFDFKDTGIYYFGSEEMYGYKAIRIYRKVLLAELRKMVEEEGIPLKYGKKYTQVVFEDDSGVRFAFSDDTEDTAEILIGADGIHSKVRQYIAPDIEPTYSGFLGVTFAFPASKIRFPAGHTDFPLPVSIMGKHGMFALAPQNADGKEIFAGRQFHYAQQTRSSWDALLKEKSELIEMHRADMKDWSDLVQSAIEQLSGPDGHSLSIWAFHTVPKLERWYSPKGRVIIMGDAAHAIPPTAGQGANQAFEDSLSLAFLLKSGSPDIGLTSGPKAWQEYRQARVDRVIHLSNQMNNLRLSEEEKKSLPKETIWHDDSMEMGKGAALAWLYLVDIEKDMAGIVEHSL